MRQSILYNQSKNSLMKGLYFLQFLSPIVTTYCRYMMKKKEMRERDQLKETSWVIPIWCLYKQVF